MQGILWLVRNMQTNVVSTVLAVAFLGLIRPEDCGLEFDNGGAPIAISDCNMACAGNSSEFCGGPNALNVCASTLIT